MSLRGFFFLITITLPRESHTLLLRESLSDHVALSKIHTLLRKPQGLPMVTRMKFRLFSLLFSAHFDLVPTFPFFLPMKFMP